MDLASTGVASGPGEICIDWKPTPLQRFSAFITKGATPTTYGFRWQPDGVLFLRSECVSEVGLDLKQAMFIAPEAHAVLKRGEVRAGDILMTITGNVGRVLMLPREIGFANINQHIARIRVADERVDSRFICHFLSQPRIRAYFESIVTGQAYPQISLKQVRETIVPLPALPEQRLIADALDIVDTQIATLDRLIAKKRNLKQGAMQQLLTAKTRLPEFSGEWEDVTLGRLGSFSKGRGITREDMVEYGLPCIRYGEIYTRHKDYVREFYSSVRPEVARESQRLHTGDLLFTGSGETAEEIGKCVAFLGNEDAFAGGDIVIFSPVGQDSMFLGYLMNYATIAEQKSRMGQGDAVVHISARSLGSLRFKRPNLPEQKAIASILSDLDAEIAVVEQRRDKTRDIKQGMMQELLTGRTRLI